MSDDNGVTPTGEQPQGEGAEAGLFDLSSVPEEYRQHVEGIVNDIQGRVTPKFQEHAEYRKRMEPYEQIEGFTDVPPEELAELIQFRQVLANPESLEAWWEGVGQQFGWFEDDEGGEGGDPGMPGELDPQALMESMFQQFEQRLDQRLGPIEGKLSEREENELKAEIQSKIDADLKKVEDEHGELGPEGRQFVLRLAHTYASEPDAIERAFADYQAMRGQAQSEGLEPKLNPPPAALPGGQPDATPEEPTSFDEAKRAAMARL